MPSTASILLAFAPSRAPCFTRDLEPRKVRDRTEESYDPISTTHPEFAHKVVFSPHFFAASGLRVNLSSRLGLSPVEGLAFERIVS